ncbi:MAG: S41 family peptidase [Mucinivorans sp.]
MKKVFLILLFLVVVPCVMAQSNNKNDFKLGKALEIFANLMSQTSVMYVDSIDPEGMIKRAADAMFDGLDPYTEYLPESKMDDFEFSTTGKYGGVGALIRQNGPWVEILEPYLNTPADKAGLKAGDRILAIDGVSMKSMGAPKVSATLKGNAGDKLTVLIAPISDTNTTREVVLVRERITLPSVPYFGVLKGKIGYIMLTSFTDNCASEVRHALLELIEKYKIEGLVLDLRGNGGGVVGQSISIAGLFLPHGTEVVSLRGRTPQSNTIYKTTGSPLAPNLPLAVLVNSSSASASEILAGAIQDLDRGVILGQRSFGKGLVQGTHTVGYGAFLKVTTARYYTPSGRSIQALDYTHRREDGSVGTVPDSLITEFKTTNGRKVYNGGGVNPDVKLEAQYLSKFTAILLGFGFIDSFANEYAAIHPADSNFKVDGVLYNDFKNYMKDKTIKYRSQSDITLEKLRQMAVLEKYSDRITVELDAIAAKIKEDKDAELNISSDDIKRALTDAILQRWFYLGGRIQHSLLSDTEATRAAELLKNKTEYERILKEQDTTKN